MFEIRVICDPIDTDRVTTALAAAFTTGDVRRYPTRDGKRARLYLTADHRPTPAGWPTPEQAYADAPRISNEIGWTTETSAHTPIGQGLDREYFLRKAAVLDRMALTADSRDADDIACAATEAARHLMGLDDTPVICDPRRYVRQQYAHWATHH
ncbi:hypothetical protein QCN29_05950 [Streptomyces sp. HNM0663]|uniref:Uncharacterized protein n=1 Tax=Streptomyces chengmaiensis TaxID=3040919 RepID=A0ABT6HHY3_9ACTN|nr:hypothetical protein [Streptomyces chengmaiensis]MDH2388335.1 hypothetical protein [Streptomyces chengmaiensis]